MSYPFVCFAPQIAIDSGFKPLIMIVWIGFLILIFIFLALDLGVFNKEPHKISTKEAIGWTALWIAMSFLFSAFVYFGYENHCGQPPKC